LNLINRPERDWVQINGDMFDLKNGIFQSLLRQFERRGFLKIKTECKRMESVVVSIEVEADDHLNRGGFVFEEEAFRNDFTKLELELATLEGEIPVERFNTIMTLLSTAATSVSAYSTLSSGS
jgi:hypothetical protein